MAVALLGSVSITAGTLPPLTIVAYDSWWEVPNRFAADDGVAVFRVGSQGWAYRLDTFGTGTVNSNLNGGPYRLSGTGSGDILNLAASSDHVAASRATIDGFLLYEWVAGVDIDGSAGLDPGTVRWTQRAWTTHVSRPGWFGYSMAIAEGMVLGSVDFSGPQDQIDVYRFHDTDAVSLVQTIVLPGSLPTQARDAIQVHGRDVVVVGRSAIWHYALSGGLWTLSHTIPAEGTTQPLADVGQDIDGTPVIAYTLNRKSLYIGQADDPVGDRVGFSRGTYAQTINNLAIDAGVLALTAGTAPFRDLEVFSNLEGTWEVGYYVTHTSIGGIDEYARVDANEGHFIVQGTHYSSFEPDPFVEMYATLETVTALRPG